MFYFSWLQGNPKTTKIKRLGTILGHLDDILAQLGSILALSWPMLESSLTQLAPLLAHLGPLLAHLGHILAHLGTFFVESLTRNIARPWAIVRLSDIPQIPNIIADRSMCNIRKEISKISRKAGKHTSKQAINRANSTGGVQLATPQNFMSSMFSVYPRNFHLLHCHSIPSNVRIPLKPWGSVSLSLSSKQQTTNQNIKLFFNNGYRWFTILAPDIHS